MTDASEAIELHKPRANERRRQIIDAAAKCFRRDGFHSASMAEVAKEAGMSVGHIYRYFTGKEAIIAAIVREQLDPVLARFPTSANTMKDVRAILRENALQAARDVFNPEWSSLMLEVRAEAGRNRVVAEAVQAADAEIAERVRGLIVSGFPPDQVPADIAIKIEMVGVVIEGLTFRAVSSPHIDPQVAQAMIDLVIDNIFSVSPRT